MVEIFYEKLHKCFHKFLTTKILFNPCNYLVLLKTILGDKSVTYIMKHPVLINTYNDVNEIIFRWIVGIS